MRRACRAAGHNAHVNGRFAPSPTGPLHLGNLRTAIAAYLAARASGLGFVVRMEDLDQVTSSVTHEERQLADLAALGVHPDGPMVRQSERGDRYRAALDRLEAAGLVYPCFCTRREIRAEIDAAAAAPHGLRPDGAYPGTCRDLGPDERAARAAAGRRPALRLRSGGAHVSVVDLLAGATAGLVDDVVLARSDGVAAYNLAVVVDDAAQQISQVVRGDDLLSSTPRQVLLQRLLGLPTPTYLHVPLVVGADGARLAKRHGAVTLAEVVGARTGAARRDRLVEVCSTLCRSLGVLGADERVAPEDLAGLAARFDLANLDRAPVRWDDLAAALG